MPLVYVAGPVRAATTWDMEKNIRRAEEISRTLLEMGFAPICPHSMFRFFGDNPRERILEATIEQMVRCDAVFVVGNWQESQGTSHEIRIATERAIPVFYQLDKILDWSTAQ